MATQAKENVRRAERAEAALRAYAKAGGERFELQTPEEYLIDFLTDLRHYAEAEAENVDWLRVLESSSMHYAAECGEDSEMPPRGKGKDLDPLSVLESVLLLAGDGDLGDCGEYSGAAITDQVRAAVAQARKRKADDADLLQAAKCALADLEGFAFDTVDLESDEPVALTIRELRAAIARREGGDTP